MDKLDKRADQVAAASRTGSGREWMVQFHHEAAPMNSQPQIELQQICFGCLATQQSIATTQQCSDQVFKMILFARSILSSQANNSFGIRER